MATTALNPAHPTALNFDAFATAVRHRFSDFSGSPMFVVETKEALYDLYLSAFADPAERQHHTCNCCRHFIERFGSLAVVGDDGSLESVMWGNFPSLDEPFASAAREMASAVRRGKIKSVFLSSEIVLGTPVTGSWHHFAVIQESVNVYRNPLKAAHEIVALKTQDFGTLSHGLADFDSKLIASAINLLEADALFRGDKFIGPARFLLDLHTAIAANRGYRKNLIWKAVAKAPVGWATPRSGMIGTLLEDLKAGIALPDVKKRFAAKMNVTQYQRPSAPPSAGNIAEAERIVEKLGIADSLRRRFATIEEVKLFWKPTDVRAERKPGGVFGHLKTDSPRPQAAVPETTITWVKFRDTVLPKALAIECKMLNQHLPFVGVLTAAVANAPNILQWNNPFSWYVWVGGSYPSSWNLPPAGWVRVQGLMLNPAWWDGPNSTHSESVVAVLEGARESREDQMALFPEILRSDLHPIRSTIEAFSKKGKKEGAAFGTANGISINKNGCDLPFRVTTNLGQAIYKIDRWD